MLLTDRTSSHSSARVVIVGGGLSGLTVAHRLTRQRSPAPQVTLLESRDRLGGVIHTESRNGFLLEYGADSFITNKPWALDLCRELGLEPELVETDTKHRRSFVVSRGKLQPVPDGFVMMAPGRIGPMFSTPVLSWKGKLRFFLDLFLPAKLDDEDESLASFVKRRFGRETLDRLVQPLVGGIYSADPADLSVAATLPQLRELERRFGSLIRGARHQAHKSSEASEGLAASRCRESGARYGMFVTLEPGMRRLPEALAATLPPGSIRTRSAVRRITKPDPSGCWRVELLSGEVIEADTVVLAAEAHAAARMIDSADPELALSLRSVPYASSTVVQLAYQRDQIAHPLDGFGLVVPRAEGRSILAASFTSVKFPGRAPADTVLMRVFIGGATQPELFDLSDDETLALACREVAELLRIKNPPILAEVSRHPRAMPQYTLGHLERVTRLKSQAARHAGLILAGNYLGGVGLPDCVRVAQEAAQSVAESLTDIGAFIAA